MSIELDGLKTIIPVAPCVIWGAMIVVAAYVCVSGTHWWRKLWRRPCKPTGRRYDSVEAMMRGENVSEEVRAKVKALEKGDA